MTSTASSLIRVGIYPAGCGLALAIAVQLAPAPVEASSPARPPIDAAALLPPVPAPVAITPSNAAQSALFELTLRTRGKSDLMRQLRDAGASEHDASRAVELIQERIGAELGVGADFKLGLGPQTSDGDRSIETLSVITDGGMERVERIQGKLALSAPVAARKVTARIDGGAYWALRAAGLSPEIAAEAAKLADQRLGAQQDGVISAVVGERPARFGTASAPRLLLLSVERKGQPTRSLMSWPGAVGQWIDPDRPAAPPSALGRPVAGRVTSGFGARFHPILHFFRPHRGLDFAARAGDPVRATADGCVVGAGWRGGYGRQVRLVHRGELTSSYSHLSSLAATAGQCLRRGELVGYAGASGLATGPHLHFELYRAGQAVDPARILSAPGGIDVEQRAAIVVRLARLQGSPST